jgi:hypothetical protein
LRLLRLRSLARPSLFHPGRPAALGRFALLFALLGPACIKVEIDGAIPDGGTAATGAGGGTGTGGAGGSGGGFVPAFDGGRHPSAWRAGRPPITQDVPRWYVPKTAGRYRYPSDRAQSPIPRSIAEHLRNVALHAELSDNAFMKVGDSISDSQNYLGCFRGDINNRAPMYDFNIVFGGHEDLAEAIFHFRSARIGETSPFDRASKCTRVGAAVTFPLEGDPPTPLEQEFTELTPQFASTMYGTNDIGAGGSPKASLDVKVRPFQKGLVTLVDTMLGRGVIPWLSTIPPRIDDPAYMEIVPVFNTIIRGVAEGRQIPLVDFYRDLLPIAGYGLSSDGVHPTTQEYNTACHLNPASLAYGYNVRNLGALTVLDRLMKVVVDGTASLDDGAPQLAGEGNAASPFVIDGLPFSDMRSTADARETALQAYSCPGAKAAPGAEYVYQLELAAPTALRAVVLDGSTNHAAGDTLVDVDVYLLDATRAGTGCIASADAVLETVVGPGTFYVVVDTTSAGPEVAGEYTLAVVPCEATDTRCVRVAAGGHRAR